MLKNNFIVVFLCFTYFFNIKFIDGRIRIPSRSFSSIKPFKSSSSIGVGSISNIHSSSYVPGFPVLAPKIPYSATSDYPKSFGSNYNGFNFNHPHSFGGQSDPQLFLSRPYAALGSARYTPSSTSLVHNPPGIYPTYDSFNTRTRNWEMSTTTTTTVRPTSSLQRETVNMSTINDIKQKLKSNHHKVKNAISNSEGTYSNSKKKVLKLVDYDLNRKSYIISPLQQGEVKFHPSGAAARVV